ncbi:MAG TPA: hypothetical protein VJ761_22450 [Ktedonobacteraceae bacterium]|nr:hypothetical protein [Ktedonobacteraceae bacterium]
MMRVLNGSDDCLTVVIHPPQLHAIVLLVSVKQHIGRLQARCEKNTPLLQNENQ